MSLLNSLFTSIGMSKKPSLPNASYNSTIVTQLHALTKHFEQQYNRTDALQLLEKFRTAIESLTQTKPAPGLPSNKKNIIEAINTRIHTILTEIIEKYQTKGITKHSFQHIEREFINAMSQSTTQDSKIPKKETSTTPDTTRFEPTKEDTTPQKIMKSKEVMPSEEIRAEITRIFTEKQWTVIQQPDKTMKNNTHIDIIAITITLTAAMKYCYHILPIKLVPLRGTLVYGTQRFSYLGHEQKWTDQKIVDEYISEFLLDVEQLKSFVNSNSAEFRALSDTRPIHLTETKDEKGTISYHYEKRPAVIAIKPIIIYTGSLEIEKCADHLPIKYIENLGLYVCEPKKITMLIEYIMTKRDRASVSPVLSQIRQDIEHIRTQIWGRKKKLLLGVLCFQFLTLFLCVGQILSDATYLTLTIIPIVPVVGFWLYVNHSNREIPIIRGERDLIRPQNERYLQPHIEWMISSQSDDFIAQYLGELELYRSELLQTKTTRQRTSGVTGIFAFFHNRAMRKNLSAQSKTCGSEAIESGVDPAEPIATFQDPIQPIEEYNESEGELRVPLTEPSEETEDKDEPKPSAKNEGLLAPELMSKLDGELRDAILQFLES